MSRSDSFAKFDSAQMIELCQNVLGTIKAYREREEQERKDELIAKARNRQKWWLIGWLFKIPTEEDLREMIAGDYIFLRGGKAEMIAKRVLALANQSNEVYVTASDYDYLMGWSS